jgi:lactate permease
LFPISWIVLWAIVLYDLTVATGKFAIVKDSIGALTPDLRIQSIVIAFGFGAFIEGATGFGTPVAVAGAMMVGLGFSAYNAAALCLLANTAPVAFGAIGVPIIALAGITGLPLDNLSGAVGTLCSPIAVILPAYMIVAMGGFISALEVWPALLVAGLTFGVVEYLVSNFINVQLTVILSAITSMAAVIALLKVWRPRSPRLGKRNAGTEATALDPFEAFATDATPVPAKLNHTYGQILWLDAVYHPGRSRSSLGIQALPSRFGCGNLHVALAGSS